MRLTLYEGHYAVARLAPESPLPTWLPPRGFFSITRTDHELSIVCDEDAIGDPVRVERGWRMLEVEGPIDFETTGVLASLVSPLAEREISVFAISTFDTDYLLVKEAQLARAIAALESAGHRLR